MPYGWYDNSSSVTNPCPFNSVSGITLVNSSNCIVSIAAISPTAIISGIPAYNYAGNLNLNLFGFSYYDNTGLVKNLNPSYTFGNTMQITSSLFADVDESNVITGSGNNPHTITATFTLNGTVPSAPNHLPITITANIPTSGSVFATNNTCQITANNGSCNITINALAGELGNFSYSYLVSPNASSNGITQYLNFTLQ